MSTELHARARPPVAVPLRTVAPLVALLSLLSGAACTEEAQDLPIWDQHAARAHVQAVLDAEEQPDYAWDAIAWHTDPEAALRTARNEDKPLLVYFYVRRGGPPDDPC